MQCRSENAGRFGDSLRLVATSVLVDRFFTAVLLTPASTTSYGIYRSEAIYRINSAYIALIARVQFLLQNQERDRTGTTWGNHTRKRGRERSNEMEIKIREPHTAQHSRGRERKRHLQRVIADIRAIRTKIISTVEIYVC